MSSIDLVIEQRRRDLGGFQVGRVLPAPLRRMVGPFIFFDHMGPVDFFAGYPALGRCAPSSAHRLVHGHVFVRRRDHAPRQLAYGTGNSSGRSELDDCGPWHHAFGEIRAGPCRGRHLARHSGLGCVAEGGRGDRAGLFAPTRPAICRPMTVRGSGQGSWPARLSGPSAGTDVFAPVLRALAPGLRRPCAITRRVSGACRVRCGGFRRGRRPAVCRRANAGAGSGQTVLFTALEPSVLMLLGGEPIGERFIEWNFVSSSKERIEEAKTDWRAGRMQLPQLDDGEFIPLPPEPPSLRAATL